MEGGFNSSGLSIDVVPGKGVDGGVVWTDFKAIWDEVEVCVVLEN
jgi:hypothetical protein